MIPPPKNRKPHPAMGRRSTRTRAFFGVLLVLGGLFSFFETTHGEPFEPVRKSTTPDLTTLPKALPAPVTPLKADSEKQPALTLTLLPYKQIYSARESLRLQLLLTAKKPLQVCLTRDPFTQFRFEVFRSGVGALPILAQVTQDNQFRFRRHLKPRLLQPGETVSYRLNLKRLRFQHAERWKPGDYTVKATFFLCAQRNPLERGTPPDSTNAPETPIESKQSAHFMIMN